DDDEEELKYELLVKAANRYQNQIKDNLAAIDMLRQALDVRAADRPVLSKLEALLREEEMWPDLLETLQLEASVAEQTDDRVKLRRKIGKLLSKEMAEPSEALEAFKTVLYEAPEDEETIAAVGEIGENFDELRLEAAEILEPVLRSTGKYDKLVGVLEMRLEAQLGAPERAQTLRAIADVLDGPLSDQGKAVDALIRALAETPEDTNLHNDIERLAESSDGYAKYADTLEERASKIFEAALATDLWKRLGRICEEKLKDDNRAVEAYTRALEQSGDTPELLESLDHLHTKLENPQPLSEILERRVSVETDARAQADLYHRLAVLQIDSFGDRTQGLETLRMALDHAPDHERARETLEKLTQDRDLFEEAASALEVVYRAQSDYESLAGLYEKRVSFADAPMDRLQVRLELAQVLEEQAFDSQRAQRVMEAALGDDPADNQVLGKLQDLAELNHQWTEAAKAVSEALQKADGLDPMTA
ncbi:MAG: hypothetical protein CSA75_04840, partial [Sorangium cellulosum]